jgi:hypothetical protein
LRGRARIELQQWQRIERSLANSVSPHLVERAGIEAKMPFKVHPHMLRHATGYALANKGTDTRTLQAYLGHRSIQSTVRFGLTLGNLLAAIAPGNAIAGRRVRFALVLTASQIVLAADSAEKRLEPIQRARAKPLHGFCRSRWRAKLRGLLTCLEMGKQAKELRGKS